MLDLLSDIERAVSRIEPMDVDVLLPRCKRLLERLHLPRRAAAVVASLYHEDGCAKVIGIGDRRRLRMGLGLLVWRSWNSDT